MDAPPEHEDLALFLRVSRLLEGCDVHVPHVHAADLPVALRCSRTWAVATCSPHCNEGGDPDRLYAEALDELLRLQLRAMRPRASCRPTTAPC